MKKIEWVRFVVVASCIMALRLHIEGTEHEVSREGSRTQQQPGVTAQQRALQEGMALTRTSSTAIFKVLNRGSGYFAVS
jgi:hypothetical protein